MYIVFRILCLAFWLITFIIYTILPSGSGEILGIIFVSSIIIFHGVYPLFRTYEYTKNEPCLTFKQFISFYNINPDSWECEELCVKHLYRKEAHEYVCKYRDTYYFKRIYDMWRYRYWLKEKIRNAKNKDNVAQFLRLTSAVRKDIDKEYTEAEKCYAKLTEDIKKNVRINQTYTSL